MKGTALAFIIVPASNAAWGFQGISNDFEFAIFRCTIEGDKATLLNSFQWTIDCSRTLTNGRWNAYPIDTALDCGIPDAPEHQLITVGQSGKLFPGLGCEQPNMTCSWILRQFSVATKIEGQFVRRERVAILKFSLSIIDKFRVSHIVSRERKLYQVFF